MIPTQYSETIRDQIFQMNMYAFLRVKIKQNFLKVLNLDT